MLVAVGTISDQQHQQIPIKNINKYYHIFVSKKPLKLTNPKKQNHFTQKVVCGSTGVPMVHGPILIDSDLTRNGNKSSFNVSECYQHLPDMGNSWPEWKAQTYGYRDHPDDNHTWVNALDISNNLPHSYGPWASGMLVDSTQDAGIHGGLSSLSWSDAASGDLVVHAMADGEWGGVQFRVSNATRLNNGDAVLFFSEGGYQQARGASLHAYASHIGNRYYIEGSLEFLDSPGEWHYDRHSHTLWVVPPADVAGSKEWTYLPLVLTQSDRLLSFEGEGRLRRVQNIVLANLTLQHSSAQFFQPHEETSGGDYAIARSGAVFAENVTSINFEDNTMQYLGGNGIFLSNSARNVSILRNRLSFLGSSAVLVVGHTGHAMMDARDGEALAAMHGDEADNGVRLPRYNVVSGNVISDFGVWDKQSAAFHKVGGYVGGWVVCCESELTVCFV